MTSIIQGLVITAGALGIYQFAVYQGYSEPLVRTMVFSVLISANVTLTMVNRSFYYSVLATWKYKNNLVILILLITACITGLLFFLKPFARFFGFEEPNATQSLISIGTGTASVIWYEAVKWAKRRRGSTPYKYMTIYIYINFFNDGRHYLIS